jgi:beta-glucosidase
MRFLLSVLVFAVLAVPALTQPIAPLSPERRAEIDRRVEALLARMTLEEKVGQLNLAGGHDVDPADIQAGRVGGIMNVTETADINGLQRLARSSRLGIPLIFGLDAVHGYRTIFTWPLGQASTWNPRLVELAAEWTAREARAAGMHWTFAPMVDMSRDPRWGRVMEGSGEDVFHAQVIAAARTRGYQRGGLAATPKHFAGYGAVDQGRDYNSTWIPTSLLFDFHIPPFQAAIEAGALTVMAAFNAVNGLPATAHRWLLTDVLKQRLGFDGFVVSDFNSIGELVHHGVARDDAEAARLAISAGIDVDMVGYVFHRHLADEVRAGRVPMSRVDDAVRRVLRVKLHLGLFDQPEIDRAAAIRAHQTPEARQAAIDVARESFILLKNDGVLPLQPEIRRIAVVGALAVHRDDNPWPGPEGSRPPEPETVLEAIRRLAPSGTQVEFARGTRTVCGHEFEDKHEAVRIAREADVVVAVLGEDCLYIGEAASRTRLDLPGIQPRLFDALVRTGKPVVLVLMTGRPHVLVEANERAAAILQTYHPGGDGRSVIAEMLFGWTNPSGRTTFSFPRSVGQIPIHYDQLPTGRPLVSPDERWKSRFMDEALEPLFPFGFGLSYTTFAYSDVAVSAPRMGRNGVITVSATVTNTGRRAGKEVVQLYVRQLVARRSRPVRQLKGFEKVELAPGESRRVSFSLRAADLGYHDDDGNYAVDPGPFRVGVGGDSRADLTAAFDLVE